MNNLPNLNPQDASLLSRISSASSSAQLYVNYAESNPANFLLAGLELLQQLTFEALLLCHQAPNKFHFDHAARMTKLMTHCRQQELQTLRTLQATASVPDTLLPAPQPTEPSHHLKPSTPGSEKPSVPPMASNSGSGDASAVNPSPSLPGPSTGSSNSPAEPLSSFQTPAITDQNSTVNAPSSVNASASSNRIRIAKSRLPPTAQSDPAQPSPTSPLISPEVAEFPGILQSDFDARVMVKYLAFKDSHWTWQECEEMVRREIRSNIKRAAREKAEEERKAQQAARLQPTPPATNSPSNPSSSKPESTATIAPDASKSSRPTPAQPAVSPGI